VPAGLGLQCAGATCTEAADLETCCEEEKCCHDHPQGCEDVKNLFDKPKTRVLLIAWEGCPCTGIARERFHNLDLCFEELSFPSPTDEKMRYMMCKYGSEHHSFIFMRNGNQANAEWNFEKNGFLFDKKVMSEDTLVDKCNLAGALKTCPAAKPQPDTDEEDAEDDDAEDDDDGGNAEASLSQKNADPFPGAHRRRRSWHP